MAAADRVLPTLDACAFHGGAAVVGVELVEVDREREKVSACARSRSGEELAQVGSEVAGDHGELIARIAAAVASRASERDGGEEAEGGARRAGRRLASLCELSKDLEYYSSM